VVCIIAMNDALRELKRPIENAPLQDGDPSNCVARLQQRSHVSCIAAVTNSADKQ
jgi:hypothetical protein